MPPGMNAPFQHDAEVLSEEVDPFLMANLYPKNTGLPMTIWAGPKAGVRHDVRVKVSMAHGDRMNADNLATVSVRPEPQLLHGKLATDDLRAVTAWISLNTDALIRHWDGVTDTMDFLQELKRLTPPA